MRTAVAVEAPSRPERRRADGGTVAALAEELSGHGMILRGGFHPDPFEPGLEGVETVVLVGNAGGSMWEAFAPHLDRGPDPLNRWTKAVVEPVAASFEACAFYPFGEPNWPFQRWAERAGAVFASPLGILIDPVYGLWHAYRAALGFRTRLPVPARIEAANPCESCTAKPCLTACPVGAFNGTSYDVPACAGHLAVADPAGSRTAPCHSAGCLARNACPIGEEWRYPEAQIRFHMAAFGRAILSA